MFMHVISAPTCMNFFSPFYSIKEYETEQNLLNQRGHTYEFSCHVHLVKLYIVHGHQKIESIGIGSKNLCNYKLMSNACTSTLVGVVSLVLEILLLSKTAKFPFLTMDYSPWSVIKKLNRLELTQKIYATIN